MNQHMNGPTLDEACSTARALFRERHPESEKLFERAQSVMPGGNTRTALHFEPFPVYVKESAGCHITDVDGYRYLDALGEFTAGLYGHSHPILDTAIVEAARSGMSNGAPGECEIALAELLCARFPAVESIRFCNSGTEANLYALTLARIATGRPACLAFTGGYHGGVLAFAGGGSPMNVPFEWIVGRYNDPAIGELIESLGDRLAAVIIEPLLSNGGCIAADPAFLSSIREATKRTGALLIFDEVVTSRMSSGGLQKRFDITPDMTTFGKYIGAGFSFGAFGGRAGLMDRFDPRKPGSLAHAGTFNNNVYSMAVGHKALSEVFTPERADRLFDDGERLRERLNAEARQIAPEVQFTGGGSIMNIHFAKGEIRSSDDLKGENRGLFQLFHLDMLQMGVYIAARGQINLSLPMEAAEFERIEAAVVEFLQTRRVVIAANVG